MGLMHYEGRGLLRDMGKALEWFKKSAAQHYPLGQYNLGVLYQRGLGVEQDGAKAVELSFYL